MLTHMTERKYIEKYEYSREFISKSDKYSGYAFTCTKDGEILGLDEMPERLKNYKKATESGEYIDLGITSRDISYWTNSIGTCECGRKVELVGFTNTCECGLEYNSFGQELAPREEWEDYGWFGVNYDLME